MDIQFKHDLLELSLCLKNLDILKTVTMVECKPVSTLLPPAHKEDDALKPRITFDYCSYICCATVEEIYNFGDP